jgi:hypothetical protein
MAEAAHWNWNRARRAERPSPAPRIAVPTLSSTGRSARFLFGNLAAVAFGWHAI